MNWKEYARAHLAEHLDERGDLAPPWERFPTYERCTIGWRMGAGESWLDMWNVFSEELDPGFEARLAYLRRHAPAPVTWADWVWDTLHPDAPEDDDRADAIRLWGMAAFDDRETLRRYLDETSMPASWEGWIGEQFFVD